MDICIFLMPVSECLYVDTLNCLTLLSVSIFVSSLKWLDEADSTIESPLTHTHTILIVTPHMLIFVVQTKCSQIGNHG